MANCTISSQTRSGMPNVVLTRAATIQAGGILMSSEIVELKERFGDFRDR